jgi:hypothetical protein
MTVRRIALSLLAGALALAACDSPMMAPSDLATIAQTPDLSPVSVEAPDLAPSPPSAPRSCIPTRPGPAPVASLTDGVSGVVAVTFVDPNGTGARNLEEYVRALVERFRRGEALPPGVQFPLPMVASDEEVNSTQVRALKGLQSNVIARWLDPLDGKSGPSARRLGANADYTAYFGDGWGANGAAPQWSGSPTSGFLWVNHEYVSGSIARVGVAPTSSYLTLAAFLKSIGVYPSTFELAMGAAWTQPEVDRLVEQSKRQLGGSFFHVKQDSASCTWSIDTTAPARRYDATSATLLALTGHSLTAIDKDDAGADLPPGVTAGLLGDCSGAVTPWGTVISAEENVQDYYGDFECWDENQRLVTGTRGTAGACGYEPGGDVVDDPRFVAPADTSELGRHSTQRHNRDVYGYLAEVDPEREPGDYYGKPGVPAGAGHRKLGFMGRARWENATFAVGGDWRLIPGQPVVMYGGDDRRGGRIFKWVTRGTYAAGMTRAEVRELLASGRLYVAHFAGLNNATGDTLGSSLVPPSEARPGEGRWILLSVDSTDPAPNAVAAGKPATYTVGEALKDRNYNRLGGFPNDNAVRNALFTAANKIGVMELNRPEDIEYNPRDPSGRPRLYVAFSNHGRKTALDADGLVWDPSTHATLATTRPDRVGSIFAIEEAAPSEPAASKTFKYFMVYRGARAVPETDAATPDNIMIDINGGVWFGTDGNFSYDAAASRWVRLDALYYLDVDPAHRAGNVGVVRPTYGLAFRVLTMPSDAEATGPTFSPDLGTIFISVQHPNERASKVSWP